MYNNLTSTLKLTSIVVFNSMIAILFCFTIMLLLFKPPKVEVANPIATVPQKVDLFSANMSLAQCIEENFENSRICFDKPKEQIKVAPSVKQEEPSIIELVGNDFLSANSKIQFFYWSITLFLMLQLSLIVLLRVSTFEILSRYLHRNKFSMSEAFINIPITFGVLATILAFGLNSSDISNGSDLMQSFQANNYDAITTTLLGGFVYAINSILHIGIQKDD